MSARSGTIAARPRVVGVVPAAGYATRLQPLDCSKELLRVGPRPVIDYVVDRMRSVPADEIRIVTRPEKTDVVAYAEAIEATVVLGSTASVPETVALALGGLGPHDVVLIGFPDTIWNPVDGFARLLRALDDGVDAALGVFRSPEPERADVVVLDDAGGVRSVVIKAARPPADTVWGAAAVRVAALEDVEARPELGHRFAELARLGRARAVRLGGWILDVGTPEALEAARAGFE